MPKDAQPSHPCHHAELKKLNRVAGQIEGVKKMIDAGRYCIDILTQLRAARAALRRVEADILESHLNSCVVESFLSGKSRDAKIRELKELYRKFDD